MTIAFTASALSLSVLQHALGERDDEHLAGRVAQDVVDRRREEPRLPPPARRGAEHDQVGPARVGLVDDRIADRAGADDVACDLDAVLGAEQPRLRRATRVGSSCASTAAALERRASSGTRMT